MGDGAPVMSACESASQKRLPWTGQLLNGTLPTSDRHQHGFRWPGDLRPRAVTPVQVCRCQAYAAGEVPPRQLGAAYAVAQDAAQPFGRDLAWHTKRATDVLMMDGDIEQGEPAPKGCGQPLWPKMSTQPVKELFGAECRKFVNADLVDVYDPAADGAAKHAEQIDAVEAHHMSDDVSHAPALTQRWRLPLLERQSRQEIGQVRPLGRGHLNAVHPSPPKSELPTLEEALPSR